MIRRLYLAGPDVFAPDAAARAARKKALCIQHGFHGLHPLDTPLPAGEPHAVGLAIYRANRAMMDAADAIIADLTPFRGPSADPGTVFELGLMAGLGRPVFGYSTAVALFADRTRRSCPGARLDPARGWLDSDGMLIEDFGMTDNLMIAGALDDAGHPMQVAPAETGFLACLVLARRHFQDAP